MLQVGSGTAAVYWVISSLLFSPYATDSSDRFRLVVYLACLFEAIAIVSAVLAALLFGPDAKLSRLEAFKAVAKGIACVVLASPTPLAILSLFDRTKYGGLELIVTLVVVTHLGSFFIPEILGGLCGYAIWRTAVARRP